MNWNNANLTGPDETHMPLATFTAEIGFWSAARLRAQAAEAMAEHDAPALDPEVSTSTSQER